MNDEAFLRAIAENPNDNSVRLVYADWLEEQGDPRGEFLRLECQLQQILMRHAELRHQIDPTWLARVFNVWAVVLHSYPPNSKISTIKAVRSIVHGMGLKEAKDFVESPLPRVIRDWLTFDEADALRLLFEPGIHVTVEPHAVPRDPLGSTRHPHSWRVTLGPPGASRHNRALIQLICDVTGLPWDASVEFATTLPRILKENLSIQDALELRNRFAGLAIATIEPQI